MRRIGAILCVLWLAACQSQSSDGRPREVAAPNPDQPVALVEGRRIDWEQLRPALLEARGAQVLADAILGEMIEIELARRQIAIGPRQIEDERRMIVEYLSEDPDEARRLFAQIRRERGIGRARYEALLRRSAGMRALVRERVTVTQEDIRRAYETLYGPRYRVRLITVATAREATDMVSRARGQEPFSALAFRYSTDVSSAQGGLLPPISPLDPTFPAAIRKTVSGLEAGEVSEPLALDEHGFAVLKLEEKIEGGEVPFDDVRDKLARWIRRRMEKLHQDKLSREMVARAEVIVFEPELGKTWRRRIARMQEGR